MSHVILLPQSLVDAKGDLLVGSADNAVVRKAVGADGQILTADSSQPGGVKWSSAAGNPSSPKYKYRAGGYYRTPGVHLAGNVGSIGGYVWMNPIWIPGGQAFDRMGIIVDSAGTTGSLHRLVIYRDAGNGLPGGGALALDAGTVPTDGTGSQEKTIAWTSPADDIYHLMAIQQAGSGGSLRAVLPLGLTGLPEGQGMALSSSARGDSTITGAAPGTCPVITWGADTASPSIYLRAA